MSSYFFVSLSLVVGSLCLNFDIFRNTVPLTDSFTSNSSDLLFIYLFIYLPAFLDTGLPRGNVDERDSGPMRGAIPTQSHNP